MKFEFPEINKVCFETESIAAESGGTGDPSVKLDETINASYGVI